MKFTAIEESQMANLKPNQTIVVTGDVTMDWNLARARQSKGDVSVWNANDSAGTTWQRGGSALLADLIEALAARLTAANSSIYEIRQTAAPRKAGKVLPESETYHHSYAIWAPHKFDLKSSEKTTWRVEEFLGLNRADQITVQEWQKVVDDTPNADIVVLDDADLGFRDHPELWPAALDPKKNNKPWVVLKMTRPLAQGPLWEHLHRDFSDRLIVIATVDDLRLSEVQISQSLSWERTAQDVYWELVHNPCINAISHCAHVVISFGPAGAILLSRKNGQDQPAFECSLFFDSKGMEKTWEKSYPGGMVGYTTCLTAGIVHQLMIQPASPDMATGIQSGLCATRTLHLEGYGDPQLSASKVKLVFPINKVGEAISQPANQFAVVKVQDPMRFITQKASEEEKPNSEGFWTILQDHFTGGLDKVASQVVLEGPEVALKDVPWGQFGALLTVDRQEIESYRSISNLVAEYAGQKQVSRPLSIAVFGTPGSGKSFGVTEMAKTLLPGQIEPITFNLSQFDSADGLTSALHQVRDIALGGKIPLVFWDEFDSSLQGARLGWLRYFLAPMQDGKFQEGQITHPIGRAIFVFAGGTSSSMSEFKEGRGDTFKDAKGPDFISRLKGYINILGPNPVKCKEEDPFFIIRRAILLRSSLKRGTPQLFEKRGKIEVLHIDRGVLRALLKIENYRHGARSIESIFAMSQLMGKSSFERSCLPPESQLDLHVDGKKFLALVHQLELEGKMLEDLAEAAHEVFCELMKSKGYRYGEVTDDIKKTHNALMPYANLPEDIKEANRLNVRDIPAKLAAAGYIMIPARSNEPPFNFPGKPLEILAEEEHNRWMKAKLDAGWVYGTETDRAKKTHKCLLPWDQLPDSEKEKDRELVRGIPKIVAKAGYAIVKV